MYGKEPHVKNEKEQYLWTSLCQGDRYALDQLFRLFYSPLLEYGLKIVTERESVKDGIQELFLKLWSKHTMLGKARSVEVYLLVSLRRILIRKIQNQQQQLKKESNYLSHSFTKAFTIEQIMIKDEQDSERKESLLYAINHLNARQKETLFLRYYHGLTNQEIADIMEINSQSVRNNLSRALQSLRSIVQSVHLIE